MNAPMPPGFSHRTFYGQLAGDPPGFKGPVPEGFTFNSPVGVCMDRCRQVWVCDTGNNRIVILDAALKRILAILACPQADHPAAAAQLPFHLPFHLCLHPRINRIYITDMGNGRVVAMDFEPGKFRFASAFGDAPQGKAAPLTDPNGIAITARPEGGFAIHVNDEFFREGKEKRSRCVRYDEAGRYLGEFRSVIDPEGVRHDLFWPQGLAADAEGNLYIANTGRYEILKCPAAAPVDEDYCVAADLPVISHGFGKPCGVGMLNIMRSVAVINERVFVPDHIADTISVYSTSGQPLSNLAGIRPSWRHDHQPVDSPTDPLYYMLENLQLVGPYAICAADEANVFYVTEPFCSRLLKLRVLEFDRFIAEAPDLTPDLEILAAVGGRRDEDGQRGADPQFNCVTSVVSLRAKATGTPAATRGAPAGNPLQTWLGGLGRAAAQGYNYWFGPWLRRLLAGNAPETEQLRLNLDAGNWEIRAYREDAAGFEPAGLPVVGVFVAGNIGMAVHHPAAPLFGQLVPGTPILFVSNFNLGTVSMYQLNPLGQLVNYGLPFGRPGAGDGCLHGPQGMAVSDAGEIYVADALNNRMTQWQLLPSGEVIFVRTFVWCAKSCGCFYPTDVAIDAGGRVFVTDQFNNRICVFDRTGKALWTCGEEGYWDEGDADGERFMLPASLAIDGDCLIVNDLVNRALKRFRIGKSALSFEGGIALFKRGIDEGGVWMPFFLHAQDGDVYVADSTYNVVQVFTLD